MSKRDERSVEELLAQLGGDTGSKPAPANVSGDVGALLTDIEGKPAKARKRNRRIAGIAAAVVAALAIAFAVWWFLVPPDILSYAEEPITIIGLESEEVTVTPAELLGLDCESLSVSGTNAAGGNASASAYGPTLETLLQAHGRTTSDYVKVRFHCKDGYKVVLRDIDLADTEVLLGVSKGKIPLEEYQQPLRIVMPGTNANQWCYCVTRIELLVTDPGVESDSTAVPQGQQSQEEGNGQ